MDQRNAGPTVFDINKPHTFGASASARPMIVGHRPTMPDPMVTPRDAPLPDSSKITVRVDEPPGPPAATEDTPQPFVPRSPYTPVSDLTSIPPKEQLAPSAMQIKASPANDEQLITTKPRPSVFGSGYHGPVNEGNAPKNRKSRSKRWLLPLVILILLVGAYAAIDKGLIFSSLNLPFHIFKKTATATNSPSTSPGTQLNVPSGFTATKLVEANLTFAYPTAWGAPTATTDQGFSKRSSSAKADASYAFIVNFPNNKDVQMAITSGKILPPPRTALYYDLLGWCLGTADAKYYAGVLRFAAASGVDTPVTITCDQGPLNNVAKLTSDIIVQTNLKNADGSPLGNIYTKNLKNNDYVVARAKDATGKNGDFIQTMLGSVQNL